MPEWPDITLYETRARERLVGHVMRKAAIMSPFVLRTAAPPLSAAVGRRVNAVSHLGKRIVLALDGAQEPSGCAAHETPGPHTGPLWLVIHLMIAGRLRWLEPGSKVPGRIALAAFEFDTGTLVFTEAGTQRRAALHCIASAQALAALDAGGIDILSAGQEAFAARLTRENHTLKRALTDPRLFSGIGNAYSDEILHQARLSPLALTSALTEGEVQQLFAAACTVLRSWAARLAAESPGWPEKVTAFHPAMAVHGRYGQPCPACGAPVQRIVYAANECNYCARCQTGGRLLADRSLSRLLKASWPRSIDDI